MKEMALVPGMQIEGNGSIYLFSSTPSGWPEWIKEEDMAMAASDDEKFTWSSSLYDRDKEQGY